MPSVALFGFKNVLAMMFSLDVKNCERFEDVKNNKGSVCKIFHYFLLILQ